MRILFISEGPLHARHSPVQLAQLCLPPLHSFAIQEKMISGEQGGNLEWGDQKAFGGGEKLSRHEGVFLY